MTLRTTFYFESVWSHPISIWGLGIIMSSHSGMHIRVCGLFAVYQIMALQ